MKSKRPLLKVLHQTVPKWLSLSLGLVALTPMPLSLAQSTSQPGTFKMVVNSNQDGPIQADANLTLREAISIANGSLGLEQLSLSERQQIIASPSSGHRIEFNLPVGQTHIQLVDLLPDLTNPGLTIDGTTQPGYDPNKISAIEIPIPIPAVVLTPAADRFLFRGFTITADNITIKGLSVAGFTTEHLSTAVTPPADIFIAHRLPPPITSGQQQPAKFFPFYDGDIPPQGIVLENNWLGVTPALVSKASLAANDKEIAPSLQNGGNQARSAFGVSVFNSRGTTIRRNYIANHDGSAIITSARAENTQILENLIIGNGLAGMPDAIRLEGIVSQSNIQGNLLCGNDGSGVYLFKPEGSVQIVDNQILFNGRRLRRAAVYLMGNDHQVLDNHIRHQTAAGVVVAAFPKSDRNQILGNRFSHLEGMSIDLNTQQNVGVQDFQTGDGPNPPRNSPNRSRETGNAAINAPTFLAPEFTIVNGKVNIDGMAEPGARVDLYRITPEPLSDFQRPGIEPYGPLSEPLASVTTTDTGKFGVTLSNVKAGTRIGAIATLPDYGTSEPAFSAIVRLPQDLQGNNRLKQVPSIDLQASVPRCTTPPSPPEPPLEPVPSPQPTPPTIIRLKVPRRVHFALDRSDISPASAALLNRVAAVLKQYPTIVIELEGHTDPRASDAYNQALGLRRAQSTRNYLLGKGIDPARMTIRSLGERQRVSQGSSRVDFARDRRVEINFRDVRGIQIEYEQQETDLQIEK